MSRQFIVLCFRACADRDTNFTDGDVAEGHVSSKRPAQLEWGGISGSFHDVTLPLGNWC